MHIVARVYRIESRLGGDDFALCVGELGATLRRQRRTTIQSLGHLRLLFVL
jgi:hypothetical protein